MVDSLRRDLIRLDSECPKVILEGSDDIQLLLNGKVDEIIERDQKEDAVIGSVVSEIEDSDENVEIEFDQKSSESIDLDEGDTEDEPEKGENRKNYGFF